MKKDVAAAVAVGVAVLVMVAAIVLGFAGPARAAEDPLAPAELTCQEALASLENRNWAQVIEQLTVPGEERSSLSLSISPAPAGQAPRAVKPQDVILVRTSRPGEDTVVYQTENGGGWCILRAYSETERDGVTVPDWTVTSIVLAGTGEARRASDVIARK